MKFSRFLDEVAVLRGTRVALAIGWTLAIGYVLLGNVVDHPLRAPFRERLNLIAVSPQGWAFFTRDPREPFEQIYRRTGDGWEIAGYANGSVRNLFGIRRAARGLSVEVNAMLGSIPPEKWRDCEVSAAECLEDAPVVEVENKSALLDLCGELAVERRLPVPWAWSARADHIQMPGKVLRLRAECRGPQPARTT